MGVMLVLREETRTAHARLEAQVEARYGLMAPAPDRERYLSLLEEFWGFYEPLEQRILAARAWPVCGFDYRTRRKAHLLLQDLDFLGGGRSAHRRLPSADGLPDVSSLPRLVGALYVVEGSMLGGQVISRRLAETLGLGATTGAAFFHGYGSRTGERWREFGTFAEQAVPDPPAVREATETAREAFACFGRWLTTVDRLSPVTV